MSLAKILAFVWLCSVSVVALLESNRRALSHAVNPGCELSACKPDDVGTRRLNVVVIRATGVTDVIHYIWSTYKIPTIIIAQTSLSASLEIDWEDLLEFHEQAIRFSEKPLHSTSFFIRELWEFNDIDDHVDMSKSANISSLGVSNLHWSYINNTLTFVDTLISAAPEAKSNESAFSNNGVFRVQFSVSATDMPSKVDPHLWFTGTSSEVKVVLSGLQPTYEKSRFAAEVSGISSDSDNAAWVPDTTKSFDDEYSPGVFSVKTLYSSCSNDSISCKSFILWKPVAYIGEKVTVANSSDATSSIYYNDSLDISQSIAASYFEPHSSIYSVTWNITFGTNGDGFYEKTKYTAWTVMVGVGEPMMDEMSVLATAVISVGLGAPLIIMLGGVTFLGYKKWCSRDDDLLLEG